MIMVLWSCMVDITVSTMVLGMVDIITVSENL